MGYFFVEKINKYNTFSIFSGCVVTLLPTIMSTSIDDFYTLVGIRYRLIKFVWTTNYCHTVHTLTEHCEKMIFHTTGHRISLKFV